MLIRSPALLALALAGVAFGDAELLEIYNEIDPGHPIAYDGWHIHDPSRVVELDGWMLLAVTGKEQSPAYRCGLELWFLPPGSRGWRPGLCLLTDKPAWFAEMVPENDGACWAPTFAGPRRIYYTVSNMSAEDRACIGMLEGRGTPPEMTWSDSGAPVICCAAGNHNGPTTALDPAWLEDTDGGHWLVFGGASTWLVELDPDSGLVAGDANWHSDNPAYHLIAEIDPDSPANPAGHEWSEAPFIHHHDGFYYLYLNWGLCCRGLDSTYEIRCGRSTTLTGPYLDRRGRDLCEGGGSLLIDCHGETLGDRRYHGPGHAGIYDDGFRYLLSFHYYDGENRGVPQLGIAELRYVDGWPEIIPITQDHLWRDQ